MRTAFYCMLVLVLGGTHVATSSADVIDASRLKGWYRHLGAVDLCGANGCYRVYARETHYAYPDFRHESADVQIYLDHTPPFDGLIGGGSFAKSELTVDIFRKRGQITGTAVTLDAGWSLQCASDQSDDDWKRVCETVHRTLAQDGVDDFNVDNEVRPFHVRGGVSCTGCTVPLQCDLYDHGVPVGHGTGQYWEGKYVQRVSAYHFGATPQCGSDVFFEIPVQSLPIP